MADFVKASQVFLDNPATDVDEVLEFLAAKATELGISNDEQAVLAAFKAREAEGTTGMMSGFAIPHCKSDAVNKASVLVVKFAGDVAWDSMDGQPIRVAISLLVPEGEAGVTFLRMLSQVAVLLMNEEFRDKVIATDDPEAISALINEGIDL
ncbi:MAG: PTS sugar transporter subunit IIA [Atopobiaceae bacterium]|jgi:PTS system fructose-specific IIA component|nr:PTS sugar transporter subunit IIA [Atopobiaceae bacterium]